MPSATLFLVASLHLAAAATPAIQIITPLSFGGLLVQPFGGRITLTATGSLLPEGGGIFPGASPPASYARIRLQGPAHAPFQVRFSPANPVLKGGGGTIAVAAFHASLPTLEGKFDGAGEAEVTLGATLDIPAGATAGGFSNSVNVQLLVAGTTGAMQPMAITCTVRSPLILTALAPLDFASITAGQGGLFVVRATSGHSSGGHGPRLAKGEPHPATFQLTGPANTAYTVLLPTEALLAGPKGTIRVVNFESDQQQGYLPSGGLTFHVGAALEVKADQPRGAYQGQFRVMVAYH
jgi:hypothetical protein